VATAESAINVFFMAFTSLDLPERKTNEYDPSVHGKFHIPLE
jgi:hypothetical protein